MRAIKVILGCMCWVLALPNGVIALISLLYGTNMFLAASFAIFTAGLIRAGWFLISSRATPLLKLGRVMVAVSVIGGAVPTGTIAWGLSRPEATKATNACLNSLRQIDGAKQQWALENGKTTNDTPSWEDIRVYLGPGEKGKVIVCPDGGHYILGRIGQDPECSLPSHAKLNGASGDKPWVTWVFIGGTIGLACSVMWLHFVVPVAPVRGAVAPHPDPLPSDGGRK